MVSPSRWRWPTGWRRRPTRPCRPGSGIPCPCGGRTGPPRGWRRRGSRAGAVLLAPGPLLLAPGRGVVQALDVAPGARVPVRVPGAGKAVRRVQHEGREAELAQVVEHVHAAETHADDDGAVVAARGRAVPL